MEGQRTGPGAVAVAALAGAVLLFLIAPVIIIIIVSFSGADYLRFPPPSLSLRWYQRFFGIAAWRQAISVSTQVAFLTMVFATVLGFLAVVLGTINVVGGFVVTDRMLQMFKARPRPTKPAEKK